MKKLIFLFLLIPFLGFTQEPNRNGTRVFDALYIVRGTDTLWIQSQDTSALVFSSDSILDITPRAGTNSSVVRMFRGQVADSSGLLLYRTNGSPDQINTFLSAGNDNISYMNRYSGNLSIGSTTAPYKLYVVGDGGITGDTYLGTSPSAQVGIGTTTLSERLTVDGNVVADTGYYDYVFVDNIWHAYGGFQDSSVTVSITQNVWSQVTNATNNLFTGVESNGITLSGDTMIFANAGHYTGSLSIGGTGINQNEYLIRVYHVTDTDQEGFYTGVTGFGVTNYTTFSTPLFIISGAGDRFVLQITNTSGNGDFDLIFSTFMISYIHD